ncbi:MAG: ChaB family protein [Candidatus Aquicultorales bacterium]
MPYDSNADLPDNVKNVLSEHAQDIYREAFNSAWKQYDHEEVRSHKIAWAAVKKKYRKGSSGRWEPIEEAA